MIPSHSTLVWVKSLVISWERPLNPSGLGHNCSFEVCLGCRADEKCDLTRGHTYLIPATAKIKVIRLSFQNFRQGRSVHKIFPSIIYRFVEC